MESPRDQELISTITLVQQLLWWPKNLIQPSDNFVFVVTLNGEESAKMDHGNEFMGSKNGGNELWVGRIWPKMAEKSRNFRCPTVAAAAASPALSGHVQRRLAVKFHRHDRLDVLLPPVLRMYSDGGRNRLLWLKLERLANGSKRPSLVLTSLGSFSRVFGAQSECLGLGFPLSRKAMYI